MNNKTFIIVTVILILVSAVAIKSFVPPKMDAAAGIKVANFPMQVGSWVATEVPVSEKEYQILETKNLFVRNYKDNNGNSLYLYVVYSEDNRKVSHPPEVCLMGSGITVVDKTSVQVTERIRGTKLIVEKGNIREAVVYWFKAGNLYTDKYLRQQFKVVLDRILGKRTSGALIRVSAEIINNKPEVAFNIIKGFSRQIEPLLDRYAP